jgi:hypothetical protein
MKMRFGFAADAARETPGVSASSARRNVAMIFMG